MLRLSLILLAATVASFVNAAPIPASALASVVDNGNGTFDYTFVFDQGNGRQEAGAGGLVFSNHGLDLVVSPMTDSLYLCCNLSTSSVVLNNNLTHGGLGATSTGSTTDGIERQSNGFNEGLYFSLSNGGHFTLMDLTLNGGDSDEAFGGFGINFDINLASRHYAYGSLLSNRTSHVASDFDGVGTESALRGNLGYGANFVVTPSVSMASSNHVCQSNPGDERCNFFDDYIESVTLRTITTPEYAVPVPSSVVLMLAGLLALAARQVRAHG